MTQAPLPISYLHKAQLFYYLKLQGKDVNTMNLWIGGA